MADKTGTFKGGDDIDDPHSPHQSTSSNDDSEDRSTDDVCQSPPETNRSPLLRYSEISSSSDSGLLIDLSPENSSNFSTASALVDASGSSAQSSEDTFPDVPLDVVGNDGYPFEADAPGPSRPAFQAVTQVPAIPPVKADAPGPALDVVVQIPSIPPVMVDAPGPSRPSLQAVVQVPAILPVRADAPGPALDVVVPIPSIPPVIADATEPPRPPLQAAVLVPSIPPVKADAPGPALEVVVPIPSKPVVMANVPGPERPTLESVASVPSIPPVKADVPGSSRLASERDVLGPSSDTRPRVTLDSFPSRFVFALVSPRKRSVDDSGIPADKHIQQDLIRSEGYSATFDGTKYCYKHKNDSSSESDSCAESHSVWSVRNKKQPKNDSTCRSINFSNEAVSPRRDPLAMEPMQSFLTPPSRSEGVRLAKSTPRKRPKSTSPGTSYSKLSRSSSVSNVHRNVPNLEITPPGSGAYSGNLQTLSMEISGPPCHAEHASTPSLPLPSSSGGSSTIARPLSSQTRASTSCDPNPSTPIAHFATSNNPSLSGCYQHAFSAHLHETRKTTSPFGSRILSPPVQPSCQSPRLRMFPDSSPILNVPRHNCVLNGIRIRPPQAATEISKQLSDKTEERHASREVSQTAFDCYEKGLENLINDTLSSSRRDSPVPSETLRDSPVPSETLRDSPVPSETLRDSPVPSETLRDSPVPSETLRDSPVPSETLQDSPVPSETLQDSPTSSKAPSDGPGTSQVSHDSAPFGDFHTQPSGDSVCLCDPINSPSDTENISSGRNRPSCPNFCLEMPISSTLAGSSISHPQQSSGSTALELLATTAATQLRLQSSNIHELSLPSTSRRPAEGISPLLPSTSNSEDDASVPFIPVFPGEASTSNYQPSSSTLSIYQPSLSDMLQSAPLPERVTRLVTYLLFRRSSHFAEEAKKLLHEVCRDIVRDKDDARWLECNRPLRRPASSETERKFSKMSELQTENETGPSLGINASFIPDLLGKECYVVGLREAILSLSSNALSTTSSSQIPDLEDVLRYYNACSVLSQVFTSFKTDTLSVMDSADHSFRQRMLTLLDQISSYLERLQFALENLLLYICENTARRGY